MRNRGIEYCVCPPQVFILWMKTEFEGAVPIGFSVTELFVYVDGYKLLLNPELYRCYKTLFLLYLLGYCFL